MDPTLTQLKVANRALVEIAQGNPLTSGDVSTNFDGSQNGIYAAELYNGAARLLLRQMDWEFARTVVTLSASGRGPAPGWTYSYTYPTACERLRQVIPVITDPYDPQPIIWEVGNDGTGQVIWTNVASAEATITTNAVTEGQWDDIFTEQMVRYLGSLLSMPVAGRPDFSKEMLNIAGNIGTAGMDRDS